MSDSSVVDELIDELSEGAQLVDAGVFTFDPVMARDKLRAYQLADPNGYLLLLVEAACLAAPGGREPEIRFTLAREIVVEFLSVEFTPIELEQLLGGVLRSLEGLEGEARVRARALRLLGLAVNAALALEPKQLRVERVTAAGESVGVRFDPEGNIERFEEQRQASTRARVRFELHLPVLDNLSLADERSALRDRCRYAPFLVEVDGERVDRGLEVGLDDRGAQAHQDSITKPVLLAGEAIGVASKRAPRGPALLLLVTRGVLSEVLELDGKRPGFRAIVDVDLRKDLSQALVLRDANFEAVLDAVARAHDELPDIEPKQEQEPELPAPVREALEQQRRSRLPMLLAVGGALVVAAILFALEPSKDAGYSSLPAGPRVGDDDPRAQLECVPGDPKACLRRAQYELERGAPESADRARAMLRTACDDDPDACLQLDGLRGPIVAGQRWRGTFNCNEEPIPAVLDVLESHSRKAKMTYRWKDVVYVVAFDLSTKDTSFGTLDGRWISPAQMRGKEGAPAFHGAIHEHTRIAGEVRNNNCSSFEFTLESGVLPRDIPE